jgi:hypothetical protein
VNYHPLSIISPHVYTEVEGEKIDVSLDPGHEKIYCKNSEKKIILPVNISRLRRILSKGARPRSFIKGGLREEGHGY